MSNIGDVSIQLTNRINLGNAFSDLGQIDEAITEYKIAGAKASSGGLRMVEGTATRLIATTLNDAKRWAEAVIFAQHAAGLLRDTVDSKDFINSKCEEGTAQLALGEVMLGLDAYQEAAITARRAGLPSKLAGVLLDLVKIFSDGAGHWTIAVDQRLVATVSELDDTADSFAATFCLAAGLCGVGAAYIDALGVTTLPRREATVQVTTRSEFVTMIGEEFAPKPGEILSVTRAANEAELAPPPMHVILDDNLQLGPHESPTDLVCRVNRARQREVSRRSR